MTLCLACAKTFPGQPCYACGTVAAPSTYSVIPLGSHKQPAIAEGFDCFSCAMPTAQAAANEAGQPIKVWEVPPVGSILRPKKWSSWTIHPAKS